MVSNGVVADGKLAAILKDQHGVFVVGLSRRFGSRIITGFVARPFFIPHGLNLISQCLYLERHFTVPALILHYDGLLLRLRLLPLTGKERIKEGIAKAKTKTAVEERTAAKSSTKGIEAIIEKGAVVEEAPMMETMKTIKPVERKSVARGKCPLAA